MKLSYALCLAAAGAFALSAQAEEHLKSLNPQGISKEIPAGTDFYHHVNKKWMEANPLTDEYSRYGMFNILNDSSNNRVRRIVTGLAATNPKPGTNAYKIASLYEAAMDSTRRNKLGAQPIQAHLKKIENAKPEEMTDLFLWMHKEYGSPLIGAGPSEDLGNSKVYSMYVSGPGLGLGDRDYCLNHHNCPEYFYV